MRRLIRMEPTPPILRESDTQLWRDEIKRHYQLPTEERVKRRAPKASYVLKSPELTRLLFKLQRGKCAYCEIAIDDALILEHYRPLSNASDAVAGGSDSPDHYGWFALEWLNLMLTCRACSTAKANHFPVSAQRAAPLSSWNEARREKPLLINPYTNQIELHIDFTAQGLAVPLSERGKATIAILHLNRESLVNARSAILHRADRMLRAARPDFEGLLKLLGSGEAHCGAVALYLRTQLKSAGFELPRSLEIGHELRKLLKRRVFLPVFAGMPDRAARPPAPRLTPPPAATPPLATPPTPVRRLLTITKVDIRAFKSIGSFTAMLPMSNESFKSPCLMLLGENGSGKSSILQAIALSLATPQHRRTLALERDSFVPRLASNWEARSDAPMHVNLTFGDEATSTFQWDAAALGQQSQGAAMPPVLAYGAYRLAGRGDTPLNPIASLFNPESQLPSPLGWLESLDDHVFNAVARALRIILALKRDDQIYRTAEKKVFTRVQGRVSPIEQLSDGYRSLFAMIVDVMKGLLKDRRDLEYARGVVLIDEIEGHLHPRWKMRVVRALREAFPGVQFILTTHDPLCLRGMEKGEVVVVYRDNSGELHTHTELPDVSTLRVDQLLTSDLFGLNSATDPSTDQIVYELADLVGIPPGAQTDAVRVRRDALLTQLPGMGTIGSDMGRQIVAEAITRHLREDGVANIALRADARRESVQKIIDVLRAEEARFESQRTRPDAEGADT